jgi:hypothetical protein
MPGMKVCLTLLLLSKAKVIPIQATKHVGEMEIKLHSFIGAFARLRKAVIRFVLSARNNSAPSRRILMEFDIYVFLKACR